MDRWQVQKMGLQRAMDALHGPPASEADRRAHRQLVAREMARAEARRRQSPQLDLEE
jgi:hypothetical protein